MGNFYFLFFLTLTFRIPFWRHILSRIGKSGPLVFRFLPLNLGFFKFMQLATIDFFLLLLRFTINKFCG